MALGGGEEEGEDEEKEQGEEEVEVDRGLRRDLGFDWRSLIGFSIV